MKGTIACRARAVFTFGEGRNALVSVGSNACFGSRAAVLKTRADCPQQFQYPTTCCAAAHRGFVPKAQHLAVVKTA